MKTNTSAKIIKYLDQKKQATGKDLAEHLNISRQALFKHLPGLLLRGQIDKIGKPPKVFYFLKEKPVLNDVDKGNVAIESAGKKIIEENFLTITPAGERKEGMEGFIYWCGKTHQPVQKTAKEYVTTFKKYHGFKKSGLIDGTAKLKDTFPKVSMDHLFYLDFYTIERFGKTKLRQMLLYAKQSQNKKLIKELILDISPRIQQLIKKYGITSVGFIPPTVKRETQFMKELEKNIHLGVRKISIIKAKTEVAVPQKTLNKLADRVENASKTIIVDEKDRHQNILLIDDAVGSGATLNETTAQIRAKGMSKGKIIGLAITGSFKGFDVISEV